MIVSILGNDYEVKELTLAQKNKILSGIAPFIRDLCKHAFFRKNESGGLSFAVDDEVGLDDLNVDKIILGTFEILPELLKLSIPDFNDWDNLPESASREALNKSIEINDFKGYISNFFSHSLPAIFR